jgi:hypothetical protein
MVLPSFLIIGAEKAGTTALSQFLRQHPDVCFSRPKETWFFNRRYDKGIEWLASHFEHWDGENAIGEGTARLLQNEKAPGRIHTHLPDVRLISILRNPIDRAFSQYYFYIYTGKADPNQSFSEAIRDESSSLGRDMIQQGKYVVHLRRYAEIFDRNQMHIILHRSLRERPEEVLRRLHEFLDVDPSYAPDTGTRHNVTQYPASRTLYTFLRSGWNLLPEPIEDLVGPVADRLRSGIRSLLFDTEKPSMTERDRSYLRDVYAEPNRELEAWLGADLSHWE